MFGPDPLSNRGGIITENVHLRGWPSELKEWLYFTWKWQKDSFLTVSGETFSYWTSR